MAILNRTRDWLSAGANPHRLRWIRRGFGLLMMVEMIRYLAFDWVDIYFVQPEFHFTYPGFEWVKPLPKAGMVAIFVANGVAASALIWGLRVRFAAMLFTLGFTYVVLLDQTYYQNHWVLIGWIGAFFAVVGRNEEAQKWSHMLLKIQVGVVYAFAGIAKLNEDWLNGQPMTMWMQRRADWPVVGDWLAEPMTALWLSWIGTGFDLLIVPFLLWPRTRTVAFVTAVGFHCANMVMFKIGVFPALMLLLTTVFLPARQTQPLRQSRRISVPLLLVLVTWASAQVAIPLRHWLIPGEVAWTEEGHRFSWRMKTRSKVGSVVFHVLDTREGTHEVIEKPHDLTVHQYRKMATRPDMIRQYAVHLAATRASEGSGLWAVHADSRARLNHHEVRTLIDPTVDLVNVEPAGFGASWIIAWD